MMKKGNVLIATGLLLITAALFLTGYNLWDSHRAGAEAQDALEKLRSEVESEPVPKEGLMRYRQPESKAEDLPVNEAETESRQAHEAETEAEPLYEDEIEYPDYVLNPDMDMPVKRIDGADYIGILSISAIERELPIFNEWNYANLKKAPCRYSGTAYRDNMVICAHNYDIHFGLLKYLSYGDTVTFTDMDGNVFSYKVTEIDTLQPTAIEAMTDGDWDLTLFTCTIGGATRVTIRCEKTEIDHGF